MAGTQQSVELKLALDQEQQKSKKLEESMKKLDEEMKRTDELLYQMIPKLVADRLRKGENPVDTCQVRISDTKTKHLEHLHDTIEIEHREKHNAFPMTREGNRAASFLKSCLGDTIPFLLLPNTERQCFISVDVVSSAPLATV